MRRLIGIAVMVLALYAVLIGSFGAGARSKENHYNLAKDFSFYGVTTLGVGILIVSGGIDLSIGSLVGLSAVVFGLLLEREVKPIYAALTACAIGPVVGLFHGLLVTRARLQPFLVTLCGLFIYRGLARWISPGAVGTAPWLPKEFRDQVETLEQALIKGQALWVPNSIIVLVVIAGILAILLHRSVYGRYFQAIGANEQAARYAGIPTDRYKILAYMICSTLAAFAGVLFLLENGQATPTTAGSLLELYAITGAVLGGCSLRGGEGTIAGMLLGAAVLPLLSKICNFSNLGSELEYAVIGAALLLGTIANEWIGRRQRS
jgi:ribose transport system permease protein